MARRLTLVGLLLTALAVWAVHAPRASAAESASFRLYTNTDGTESVVRESVSFDLNEAAVSWTAFPLASANFQVVTAPPSGAASSASSSSSAGTSSSADGGDTTHGGHRGKTPPPPTPLRFLPKLAPPAPPGFRPRPAAPVLPAPKRQPRLLRLLRMHRNETGAETPVKQMMENRLRRQTQRIERRTSRAEVLHGAFIDPFLMCSNLLQRRDIQSHGAAPAQERQLALLWGVLLALSLFLGVRTAALQRAHARGGHHRHRRAKTDHRFTSRLLLFPLTAVERRKDEEEKRRKKTRKKPAAMRAQPRRKRVTHRRAVRRRVLSAILIALLIPLAAPRLRAASIGPQTQTYNGHLLNSSGQAITSAHAIRFSYWKSADYVTGDVDGSGNINTSATTYGSWQEVHTVTPNTDGYFSVELGSSTALPSLASFAPATLSGLYLQVEVKTSAGANTTYELLDVNSSSSTIDRSHLASVPFTANADMLDQRDVGTGSGSIPYLLSGGLLPVSTIPGATNSGSFVIDADNTSTSTIALTFGRTLAKALTYDVVNGRFNFNDDLRIQGNLTVTGDINGVEGASIAPLAVQSGASLTIQVNSGSYRLNGNTTVYVGATGVAVTNNATNYVFFGSGGLTVRTMSFPTDEAYIPLAQVTTANGGVQGVTDRRILQSDDREHTIVQSFHAGFEKASYQGDGASNVGQLSVSHDNTNLRNFYSWTSTKTSLQDYDVLLRVTLSPEFVRWKMPATAENPFSVTYRSTSASTANNKLDIQLYDTNGVPVTLSGSVTDLASTSWATAEFEPTGTPTWTPGQDFLLRFKFSAKDSFQMQLGDFRIRYVDLPQE